MYDKERNKQYMQEYRKKHPNYKWNSEGYAIELTKRLRQEALKVISSNLECINCKCNQINILEINHKNGGGTKEVKQIYKGNAREFYRAIKNGKRTIEDLEIRCKVCNILHDVENRFKINGFQIIFKSLR